MRSPRNETDSLDSLFTVTDRSVSEIISGGSGNMISDSPADDGDVLDAINFA